MAKIKMRMATTRRPDFRMEYILFTDMQGEN